VQVEARRASPAERYSGGWNAMTVAILRRSFASVLAGMAVWSLASLAADWLMFDFRRPMLWNELQLLSVPFAAGLCCTVASYVTARLAPLVPVWHSAPFALSPCCLPGSGFTSESPPGESSISDSPVRAA